MLIYFLTLHFRRVSSGGWALYSEPNFKGKILYQVGSKCGYIQ